MPCVEGQIISDSDQCAERECCWDDSNTASLQCFQKGMNYSVIFAR